MAIRAPDGAKKETSLVSMTLQSRQYGIELSDSVMIIFVLQITEVPQLNLPLL